MIVNKNISKGHYARKQLLSKDKLISWSHRRRFEIGLELIKLLRPHKILDYGSGDGTFLALLCAQAWRPALAVGAELRQEDVDDSIARYSDLTNLRFQLISDLRSSDHCGVYDAVVCMEVLEHVTDLDTIIQQLHRSLSPRGHVVISVPVEIGPTVAIKQAVRRLAGWRNIGDYKYNSRYTAKEMWRSIFAGDQQHIVRPLYSDPSGATFHDHKGFNWRCLKRRLETSFKIEKILTSPVSQLGSVLASQVWLVGRKL